MAFVGFYPRKNFTSQGSIGDRPALQGDGVVRAVGVLPLQPHFPMPYASLKLSLKEVYA